MIHHIHVNLAEPAEYESIKKEGDESDLLMYREIISLTDKIREWRKSPKQFADSLLVGVDIVDQFEDTLLKKCKSIGNIASFVNIDYHTVKNALNKNEVLIDFTDYILESGDRQYAAYIINNKQKFPKLDTAAGIVTLFSLVQYAKA